MLNAKIKNPLRRFNNYLTTAVIALSLYIIITPFIPHIGLWWSGVSDGTDGYRYKSQLAEAAGQDQGDLAEAPEGNTLIVPGIQIDQPIVVSDDPAAVDWGVWHRPNTSTPDKGGNTVLVGHRFAYSAGSVFYHLDKMNVGERFAVFWEGKEYVYEVFEVVTVPATAIEIESNTTEPIMTLYTCTPIWTSENRLVIKANLVSDSDVEETSSPDLGFMDDSNEYGFNGRIL